MLSKDYLLDRYVTNGLSTKEIAEECGVNVVTVQKWLKKHSIPYRRYRYDGSRPSCSTLREKYETNRMSAKEIAEEIGAGATAVTRWLKEAGIVLRGEKERNAMTSKEFVSRSIALYGGKYDYSCVIYAGYNSGVTIICPTHGAFNSTPKNHLAGKVGCFKCAIDKQRCNTEKFIKKAVEVHGDTYDYSLTNYINNKEKVAVICKNHGKFFTRPLSHTSNRNGCPKCNQSRGEIKIVAWLEKNNIQFERQKTFGECKNKRLLPFDFWIPSKNLLIEYQGKQHFEECAYMTSSNLNDRILRDDIKRKFCDAKGILFLEIKYWQDVNSTLERHLSSPLR